MEETRRTVASRFQIGRGDLSIAGVCGIAVLLLVSTVFVWTKGAIDRFALFVIAFPCALMVVMTAYVVRSSLPWAQYQEVLKGTAAGVAISFGFILAILLIQGEPLVEGIPLLLFMMGVGGLGGQLVGLSRGFSRKAQHQAKQLARQHDQLVFLNQLLRHNVLNKIAIIKGHAELVDQDYDIDDPYLETVYSHSRDVDELINNVRVLVQASTTERPLKPIDLSGALRTEIESAQQAFDGVRFNAHVPGDLVVTADPLLRYAFENVIHNAVEHNDATDPLVEVWARRVGNDVVVNVSDNGPRIPQSVIDRIREDALEANHGIGLYLVDTLMSEYGGTLEFADADIGGTKITLTFKAAVD